MKKLFKKLDFRTLGLLFQGTFVPLSGGINGSSSGSNLAGPLSQWFSSGDLPQFFNATFNMAFSAGAISAVLRLAYAGWLYMGAQDMWGSKQRAKEIIMDAVLGLLLLIGIWVILHQINPCLLDLNILQSLQGGSSCNAS
ncbi:MAG: hypothetical protein P4L81_00800 [Candidatus Pacebacteria bacterium]|nr:hypothetical protein [Candidatus Paceibacterota bacterium]